MEEVPPAPKTTLILLELVESTVSLTVGPVRVMPTCEVTLGALRKMSAVGPPKGTKMGDSPLKVIGPPATIVMAPSAMRALSIFENTKMVTMPAALTGAVVDAGAATGTLAGAVYLPVASTVPQSLVPPLQLTLSTLAVVAKVTPQVT